MELLHAVRHKKETSSYGTRYLDSRHQDIIETLQTKGVMREYGGEMPH